VNAVWKWARIFRASLDIARARSQLLISLREIFVQSDMNNTQHYSHTDEQNYVYNSEYFTFSSRKSFIFCQVGSDIVMFYYLFNLCKLYILK